MALDRPMTYTHLGERFAGPDGRVMDMRAEVAVLTRNVVVQVRRTMFAWACMLLQKGRPSA